MKTIQKRLCHASMSITSYIYSHLTEKMNREATNILVELLNKHNAYSKKQQISMLIYFELYLVIIFLRNS